jgi:hypothetical protein
VVEIPLWLIIQGNILAFSTCSNASAVHWAIVWVNITINGIFLPFAAAVIIKEYTAFTVVFNFI